MTPCKETFFIGKLVENIRVAWFLDFSILGVWRWKGFGKRLDGPNAQALLAMVNTGKMTQPLF